MSTPVPSYFSLRPNLNLYELPIQLNPLIPLPEVLAEAFDKILNYILNKDLSGDLTAILNEAFDQSFENWTLNYILNKDFSGDLTAILNEAFDQSFENLTMSLSQIDVWIEEFCARRNINKLQITLAFHSLIYEHYIKKTFPVTFSYFCENKQQFQFLLPLEERHPGLLCLFGNMMAEKQLPLTTTLPSDLAKMVKNHTEAKLAIFVIDVIREIKETASNTAAQRIVLEAYKLLFTQALESKNYAPLNHMLDEVEAMLKASILSKEVVAETLKDCAKFMCKDFELAYFFRIIKIIKPALCVSCPSDLCYKLAYALGKVKRYDPNSFWKLLNDYEDLWLPFEQKELYLSLAFEEISKDMASINMLSANVIAELIKAPFLLTKGLDSPNTEMVLLAALLERLEELDKQKCKNTLIVTANNYPPLLFPHYNAMQPDEKKRFYTNLKGYCSNPTCGEIPLVWLLALALVCSENRESINSAYLFWHLHIDKLSPALKPHFGRVFIRKLSVVEPSLAIEIFESLINVSLPVDKWIASLKEIMDASTKGKGQHNPQTLHLLAQALKKILIQQNGTKKPLCSDDTVSVQWVFSQLLNQNCLEEIKELWWLVYKSAKPDMTFLSEVLIKPFEGHQNLLLDLLKEKELYENLQSAFGVLSCAKPSSVIGWKRLIDRLMYDKDKKLSSPAWNAFMSFVENPLAWQGSPQEIAEVCLSAIKLTAFKHPSSLQDIYGKEKLIFTLFDISQANALKQCGQKIYEELLILCSDAPTNGHLERLLQFRTMLGSACNAPFGETQEWISADLSLVDMLSQSSATHLQIIAFKTATVIPDEGKAAAILQRIFTVKLDEDEAKSLIFPLLQFLAAIPEERCETVISLLKTPGCCAVLKQSPFKSWQMLCDWQKKMGEQSNFKLMFIKLGFELLPLLETKPLVPWAKELVKYLDIQKELHNKSELRTCLSLHYKKVVEILADKPEDLLKFLWVLEKLGIKVTPVANDIDICLGMIANQAQENKNLLELAPSLPWFMDLIKNKSNSKHLMPAYLNLIHRLIMHKHFTYADPLITSFLNLIGIYKLDVLQNIGSLIDIVKGSPVIYQKSKYIEIQNVVVNFILSITDFNSDHAKLIIKACHHAAEKIYEVSSTEIQGLILLARSALFIIAGNDEERQNGYDSLPIIGEALTKHKDGIRILSRWFITIFINISIQSRQKLLDEQFINLHQFFCQHLINTDKIPIEVDQLYNLIFNSPSANVDYLMIMFKIIREQPCKYLVEKGMICTIQRLNNPKLNPQDKNTLTENLAKFFFTITKTQFILSSDFYNICLIYPKLDFEILTKPYDSGNMAYSLCLLLFSSMRERFFKEPNSERKFLEENQRCFEYSKQYFLLGFKDKNNHADLFRIFSAYLETILNHDHKNFIKACNLLKERMTRLLIESQPINFEEENHALNVLYIKTLLDLPYQSKEALFAVSQVLTEEFTHMMTNNKLDEEMLQYFDQHVFGIFNNPYLVSNSVDGTNLESFKPHFNNIKKLINKAVKNNVFHDDYSKLFDYCCLFNVQLDYVYSKLTSEQIQSAFLHMVDRVGATPCIVGTNALFAIARDMHEKWGILPKSISYCWKKLISNAAKLKVDDLKQTPPLQQVLALFIESRVPHETKQSQDWQEISISICCEAVQELCNPMNTTHGNYPLAMPSPLWQATTWLMTFWIKGCFAGRLSTYYSVIEQVIINDPPNSRDFFEKTNSILAVVLLVRSQTEEADNYTIQILQKWILMLCNLNLSASDITALVKRIVQSLPEQMIQQLKKTNPFLDS